MVIALLVATVAILLFGAAAVRGVLSNALAIIFALFFIVISIGFLKFQYDKRAASEQHDQDVAVAKALTLEAVSRDIKKPQSALLDVEVYNTNNDFEMCGTIAETSGYGGYGGRERWISNGGGRFEYEKLGKRKDFDNRVELRCTFDQTAATMK